MIARYYVGGADPEGLAVALAEYGVRGATVYGAVGLWEGALEPCAVAELVNTGGPHGWAPEGLAVFLRERFDQDALLVTLTRAHVEIVKRPTGQEHANA